MDADEDRDNFESSLVDTDNNIMKVISKVFFCESSFDSFVA
jgi:hypothetical protein